LVVWSVAKGFCSFFSQFLRALASAYPTLSKKWVAEKMEKNAKAKFLFCEFATIFDIYPYAELVGKLREA
jgi:hypothetical protein